MERFRTSARQILGKLNREVVPKIKANGKSAQDLQQKVEHVIFSGPRDGSPGRFCLDFMHYGSAYENLAIDETADFDIAVILGKPFESKNFMIRRDDPSGHFTMEWKSHIPDKVFSDCNGYVDAANVRRVLFDIVKRGISQSHMQGAEIKYNDGLHALNVTIAYNNGRKVYVDFVPQIVFRTWGQIPDLRPLAELPKTLRQYIHTLNENKSPVMCFSLAVSGARRFSNPDQLFSPSFAFLEKKFLTDHVEIRDMVRLVKLVAKQRDWKTKFHYHGVMIKRVAIKNCEALKCLTEWDGYRALLDFLSQEVGSGKIDGYFVRNQVIYQWEPQKAMEFKLEIDNAKGINPNEIQVPV